MPKHPHKNKSDGRIVKRGRSPSCGYLMLIIVVVLLIFVYLKYVDKTCSFFHYPGKGIRGCTIYYQQSPLQDAARNFAIGDRDSNMIVLLESRPHILNPGNGEEIPLQDRVEYKIIPRMSVTQTFRKTPSQTAVFIGDDLPDGGYEVTRLPNTLVIMGVRPA